MAAPWLKMQITTAGATRQRSAVFAVAPRLVGHPAAGRQHGDHDRHLPDGVPTRNSRNRDAEAMQAKLDELLRAVKQARTEFIGVEHLPDKEIEAIRLKLEEDAAHDPVRRRADSVRRLLRRR